MRALETVRGGPFIGVLAGVGVLLVQLAFMSVGLGYPGLGSLQIVNDLVITAWAPAALSMCLLAAAAGAWFGVDPRDRGGIDVSTRTQIGVGAAGLALGVLAPVMAALTLADAPHGRSLALTALAIELSVSIGAVFVFLLSRMSVTGYVIAGGLLALWLGLGARAVLIRLAPPVVPADLEDPFAAADTSALQTVTAWGPVLLGAGALLGVAIVGGLVPRDSGLLGIAAVAGAPLVLYGLSAALGSLAVGFDVLNTLPPRVWLSLVAGCLLGGLIAAVATALRGG